MMNFLLFALFCYTIFNVGLTIITIFKVKVFNAMLESGEAFRRYTPAHIEEKASSIQAFEKNKIPSGLLILLFGVIMYIVNVRKELNRNKE